MRGHLVKRYKNSWNIVIDLPPNSATGKRQQQWVSVKGTRKEAEHVLANLLHQLDTGQFMKPNRKLTVADFLERWLRDYAWPLLSPKTAEGYQDIVRRHLIPKLGRIPLTELKPKHIQEFYADALSNGRLNGKGALSPLSVIHYHQCLHCALQSAVKWGSVARNVADAVETPHAGKHTINALDAEGINTLLEAARSTPYYALFHTALYTGMRRSELLGLQWGDVDLFLGQVSVTRSLHRLRNGNISLRAPKSARGRRTIALPPSACLVLREYKMQQQAMRTVMGTRFDDNELVFCQPDGRPLLPDTVTHA